MTRPTEIQINLDNLKFNIEKARALANGRKLMATVKADAYGHGIVPCAKAIGGRVDALAVAYCDEAVALRESGYQGKLLILEGPFDPLDAQQINELQLDTVIHTMEQIDLLAPLASRGLQLWLKLDSGMHRLGFTAKQLEDAKTQINRLGFAKPVVMSHLAQAESPETVLTLRQLHNWKAADTTGMESSLLNSAGISANLGADSDWLRPGYMLYGGRMTPDIDLKPVMRFSSQVIATRDIPAGDLVGYGGTWQASRPSRIATVAAGYADGYPRAAGSGTPVWVEGQICPLVGRVSMDLITVDITEHPTAKIGSPVVLWGPELTIDRVAQHADTIGYELMTRIPNRVPRTWIGVEQRDI